MDAAERAGIGAVVDGLAQVLAMSREQLRRGASQIKIMTGGGVASPTDPLDAVQFTREEIRAAVRGGAKLAYLRGLACVQQ